MKFLKIWQRSYSLLAFLAFNFSEKFVRQGFRSAKKHKNAKNEKPTLTTPTFFDFKSFLLPDYARFEHIRKFYRRKLKKIEIKTKQVSKNGDVLSSFNLRLKALISEVTVEQQILALVCYVVVALIRKIAKKNEDINFRLRSLARASWSCITLLSHLKSGDLSELCRQNLSKDFQVPPFPGEKVIRCLNSSIYRVYSVTCTLVGIGRQYLTLTNIRCGVHYHAILLKLHVNMIYHTTWHSSSVCHGTNHTSRRHAVSSAYSLAHIPHLDLVAWDETNTKAM